MLMDIRWLCDKSSKGGIFDWVIEWLIEWLIFFFFFTVHTKLSAVHEPPLNTPEEASSTRDFLTFGLPDLEITRYGEKYVKENSRIWR